MINADSKDVPTSWYSETWVFPEYSEPITWQGLPGEFKGCHPLAVSYRGVRNWLALPPSLHNNSVDFCSSWASPCRPPHQLMGGGGGGELKPRWGLLGHAQVSMQIAAVTICNQYVLCNSGNCLQCFATITTFPWLTMTLLNCNIRFIHTWIYINLILSFVWLCDEVVATL